MINITTSFETLNYKTPVPVRGQKLSSNRFLKVTVLEKDYFLSVLPGFHEQTLEEIRFKLLHFFSHYELSFNEINFSKKFFNLVTIDSFLASVHSEALFNIEVILLSMIKTTHPGLFNNNEILINDLYSAKNNFDFYASSPCLKIKISPNESILTSKIINTLYEKDPNKIYRLDGNRKFDLNELIQFESDLKKNLSSQKILKKIDYIEEPFKVFADSFLFQKRSHVTLAMDESFTAYIDHTDQNFPDHMPIVVKPSLHGISSIHNWMEIHPKKRMIVSSTFEHPSVMIGLRFLASSKPSEYHGLENFL